MMTEHEICVSRQKCMKISHFETGDYLSCRFIVSENKLKCSETESSRDNYVMYESTIPDKETKLLQRMYFKTAKQTQFHYHNSNKTLVIYCGYSIGNP